MSQYNGFLKRSSGLKGDISRERVNINVEIHPENKKRNLSFSIPAKYGIKFVNYTAFSGAVKKINAIYRFIAAKSELIMGHKAKAITAPATLIEADSAIQMGKEAPLASHLATEIKANQKEKVTVSAKLSAYIRAGLVYTKRILIPYRTKLISVPGAVAKYREIMGMDVTAKAEKAESAILESRNNNLPFGTYAHGISAPASVANVESRITADHEAPARKAVVVPVEADSAFKVSHRARLYSWVLPERNGNDLTIYQTFSGIQSGSVLEIDLEAESAYWANAFVSDGVMHLVFAETATQTYNELKVV